MTTITLTRTVATDPDSAFASWTDPAELATWWWPQFPDTEYALDVRVGGTYRILSASAGIGVRGEYLTVDRPDGFTMTWVWIEDGAAEADPDVADTVRVSFAATDGGTTVTVAHTTDEAGMDAYRQGWNDVLDRLPGSG